MESFFRFTAPFSQCGYLPDRNWQMEYEYVGAISPAEYMGRMRQGWRRFGDMLFHPQCPGCTACQPIRVVVERFRQDRSQRRVRKLNESAVRLEIGEPSVTAAKLDLYDRYHAYQTEVRGWPLHPVNDADSYASSFVDNPFPTLEWCYYLGDRLVGVGHVDDLPSPQPLSPAAGERGRGEGGGLSAIYFIYDPVERGRSLGTWNVLSIIEHAARRKIPHVYLGYYVAGSRSMEYKARFVPNEVLGADGRWREFRG